jgi:hypothetical protein
MILILEVTCVGRTVPTFRMVLEHVIHDWHAFRRALRSHDRAAFDAMMLRARQHASAASNAARLNPSEALFMAILVEHERELEQLKDRLAVAEPEDKNGDENEEEKEVEKEGKKKGEKGHGKER